MKTMKMLLAAVAVPTLLVVAVQADDLVSPMGLGGKSYDVTSNAVQRVVFTSPARMVTWANYGTNDVYIGVNQTADQFAAKVASGSALPLKAGATIAIQNPNPSIDNALVVGAGAGTNRVDIGGN